MTCLFLHNGHILAGQEILSAARLELKDGRIAAITPATVGADDDHRIDLGGGWLLPGFVDTQVNGGGGVLFNDEPTVAGIAAIGAAHAQYGTTAFLPTLISDRPVVIAKALDAVDAAIEAGIPGVLGAHIEGPFINPKRKGIHLEERLIRLDPEVMELLTRPRKGVVMLTLAPELADPADLERLAAAGVILSAGHTDASLEQALDGFAHGVRGVTHLYNAMSPLLHRAPGMVGAALTSDETFCGLIADGVHVAGAALKLALKAKGVERLMLVTDAMPGVGNGGKPFLLDGREIFVKDGICTDASGTLAGSGLDMAGAVRTMVALSGCDVASASRMASATPAEFLRLGHDLGTLAAGQRADFVMLDAGLNAVQTWIGGRPVAAERVAA
ncbi:N-acetylglucosamine-6-phosphate deacetylase [Novosphingobium terrae]|uniref:N-acetylglucosamine-6-phosphate deacetylase n=1 Tax=Novosphingobium terrae TaxID=2726189 RepID=UPI00197FBD6C|nr:N-acetylglucosamine-6-phosphate deacetylase [Novosphingobium terrae]